MIDNDNQIHEIDAGGSSKPITGPADGKPVRIATNAGGVIWLGAIDKTPDTNMENVSIFYYSTDGGTTWHQPANKNIASGPKLAVTSSGSCLFIDDKGFISKIKQDGTITPVTLVPALDIAVNSKGEVYYVSTNVYPKKEPKGNLIESFHLSSPANGPYTGNAVGSNVAAASNNNGFYLLSPDQTISVVLNAGTVALIEGPFRAALKVTASLAEGGGVWAIGENNKGNNSIYYLGTGDTAFKEIEINVAVLDIAGY